MISNLSARETWLSSPPGFSLPSSLRTLRPLREPQLRWVHAVMQRNTGTGANDSNARPKLTRRNGGSGHIADIRQTGIECPEFRGRPEAVFYNNLKSDIPPTNQFGESDHSHSRGWGVAKEG
jgi:hypothetical protein